MQSTSKLLSALSRQGISITMVGDNLKVEPRRLITDEVKRQVTQHKAEIVSALTGGEAKDSTYPQKGVGQIESETIVPLLEHSRHESGAPKTRGPSKGTRLVRNLVEATADHPELDSPGLESPGKVSSNLSAHAPVPHPLSPCLICGLPLNQDGMDCWHKAFHLGEVFPLKGVNLKLPSDLRAPSGLTPNGGNLYASDAFKGAG